jgi:hypothetical protein
MSYLKTLRPEGFFFKIPQGMLSVVGISDIIGLFKGRFFAFEVKSKTGTPTKRQDWFIRQVNRAGGIAGIVKSIGDIKLMLERGVQCLNSNRGRTEDGH